jgi:hypothetical protein
MHNQLFNPAFEAARQLVSSHSVGRFLGMCGYYFEMSHLIPNLKCHIGKLSSKKLRRIRDGKNIDYGGRVEET